MKQPDNKRTEIEWTSYLACAYSEGFCEGEDATDIERIEAWSFIAINELWKGLQGFYGRTVANLKESGLLKEDGNVDWNEVDNKLNN